MRQFYRSWRLRQPGTAVNTALYFQCGFRPTVVKVYSLDGDGASGDDGMAVDGLTDSGQIRIRAGANGAIDHDDTNNGITFEDQGFRMNSAGDFINRANAELFVEAYGDPGAEDVIDISTDLPLRDLSDNGAFGTGTQFTPSDEDDPEDARYRPALSDGGVYRHQA